MFVFTSPDGVRHEARPWERTHEQGVVTYVLGCYVPPNHRRRWVVYRLYVRESDEPVTCLRCIAGENPEVP